MARRNDEKWNLAFDLYKCYLVEEGRFPGAKTIYKGFPLGQWFHNQITADKAGALPSDRKILLDAVNSAWRKGKAAQKEANKALLVASNWKRHLKPGDVAIDLVFSGEDLYKSLSRGIYSCMDYLYVSYEKYSSTFYKEAPRKQQPGSLEELDFFSLSQRKAVFEAQFPNLDFGCFNLFVRIYSLYDLYTPEEADAMEKAPHYLEEAATLSARTQFQTRSEMLNAYETVFETLPNENQIVVHEMYFNGKSLVQISNELNLSTEKIRQIDNKTIRLLRRPSLKMHLIPDCLKDRVEGHVKRFYVPSNVYVTNIHIRDLDFSVRTYNLLCRSNISYLYEIASLTEDELMRIRNMGRKSLNEIYTVLEKYNLFLYPERNIDGFSPFAVEK